MTTYTLFTRGTPGGTINTGAGNAGTNGLHFTVSSPSKLDGIWHYSPGTSTQLPTSIGLYTTQASPATGTLVTSNTATWSGAAGSGWVFAPFTTPPILVAGTNYMATQFRNDAVNEWFVLYNVTWPVTTGIITAPQDTGTGQGWFNTGTPTAMTFPSSQLAPNNFGMDVQVSTGIPIGSGSVSKRALNKKSRTNLSKGSTVSSPATPSPFSPPAKAVKSHPVTRKSRSASSKGSAVVPGPVAPFKPPVKAVKGKPSVRKSRTSYSPVPLVPAKAPGFLLTEAGTFLLTEAGGLLETEVPPASVFSPPTSSRGKANVKKAKPSFSGGSPVILPVPVFVSPFTLPVKPVKGRASDSKSRQVKSSGSNVVPGPVAPFTPPNKAVKGRPSVKKGKTTASLGSPVVLPATPSPFSLPKKAVKGDASARKGQTRAAKGSPVVLTPPSPFNPPVKAVKGKPAATKSRTVISNGDSPSAISRPANFTAVGPIHSATANGFSLTPSSTAFGEFILLWVTSLTAADFATALTGSNMMWSVLVPHHAFSSGGSVVQTVFIGQPLNTSAQNQTITFNTGSPSVQVAWREFNCSAGFNAITLDATGFVDLATNGALPSVTPTHTNDMYATSTWDAGTGVAGNTPGFTYAIDTSNNHFAYNLQCTSSTQSPNIGDTNGTSGIGVMLSIQPSPKTAPPPRKYSKMRKSRTRHSPLPSTLRVPANVSLLTASVNINAYTATVNFGASAPTAYVTQTAYSLTPLFAGGANLLTASQAITAYPVAELPVTYVHLGVAQIVTTAHTVNAIPPTPVPLAAVQQIITAHRMFPPNPLLMSMTPLSGIDEFGNAYDAGFHLYNTSSRLSLANSGPFGNNPNIQYLPGGTNNVTQQPTTFGWSNNAAAGNQQTWLIHSSGKTNSQDDAAIQLTGAAGDASSAASMTFEFGGTVATTLKKTGGFTSPVWTAATLINGWSASGGISGIYYRYNINGEIEVMGDVIHTSATGNSVAATIPIAGPYNMNHQASWNNVAASNSASAPWVFTDTSGDIQITGISVANKEIFFHIFIPTN